MEDKHTLTLVIKKEHFDNIVNGSKKKEYRKKVPHYISRIEGKQIKKLLLINGYNPDSPRLTVQVKGIKTITKKWGDEYFSRLTYEIELGRVLHVER